MAATKNPRARLEHILFHIRGVEDTIDGVSYETFTSVYYLERTIERAVGIVSEAVKALPIELLNEVSKRGMAENHKYRQFHPPRVR